jgi:hypothetical protein
MLFLQKFLNVKIASCKPKWLVEKNEMCSKSDFIFGHVHGLNKKLMIRTQIDLYQIDNNQKLSLITLYI